MKRLFMHARAPHRLLFAAAVMLQCGSASANYSLFAGEFTGWEPTGYQPADRFCEPVSDQAYTVVEDLTVSESGMYTVAEPYRGSGVDVFYAVYEAPFDPANAAAGRIDDGEGRFLLSHNRMYDLVVTPQCEPKRGFWTLAIRGPGEASAPTHQAYVDDYMQGEFRESDPVLQRYRCGWDMSHYHSSGKVLSPLNAEFFYGEVSFPGSMPICLLVYEGSFNPLDPYTNLIAEFSSWETPGAVRLKYRQHYVFVVIAGGGVDDNNENSNEYFYLLTAQAPFRVDRALTGSWYNPNTPGQGFFIEVLELEGRNELIADWFTFELPGSSTGDPAMLGASEHRWLTAHGSLNAGRSGTHPMAIERTGGGVFNQRPPVVQQRPDGEMVIAFESCDAGLVNYRMDRLDLDGVIPIQRISSAQSDDCRTAHRGPGIPTGVNPECAGCWDY